MVSKCANPGCSASFHYLREGRLFRMEAVPEPRPTEPAPFAQGKPLRIVEHYWLCGLCSQSFTLVLNKGKVEAVPINLRAAAS